MAMSRAITIRDFRPADRAAVASLDTAFETATAYTVRVTERALELVETPLAEPRVKRYPMADAFAAWSTWKTAWVAVDDTNARPIVGFAAVEFEAWHARLVLWHLYVEASHRRAGVGRALLARVEEFGRNRGARRVWLETSSLNVPGIAAYQRLGYALCGLDTSVYDTLEYEDEAALYLAKSLA